MSNHPLTVRYRWFIALMLFIEERDTFLFSHFEHGIQTPCFGTFYYLRDEGPRENGHFHDDLTLFDYKWNYTNNRIDWKIKL